MNLDEAIDVLRRKAEVKTFGFIGFYDNKEIQVLSEKFPEVSKGFDVQVRQLDNKTKEHFFEYKGVIFFTLIQKESDSK